MTIHGVAAIWHAQTVYKVYCKCCGQRLPIIGSLGQYPTLFPPANGSISCTSNDLKTSVASNVALALCWMVVAQ